MPILPWTLARRADRSRRALLLLVLAALLYGFGMHAARACAPVTALQANLQWQTDGDGCHGESGAPVADAACEAHCRADVQSSRAAFSFDLPAAAPADFAASLALPGLPETLTLALAPVPRDPGPPLHILLQRLLR
jgi:hypothetical protein